MKWSRKTLSKVIVLLCENLLCIRNVSLIIHVFINFEWLKKTQNYLLIYFRLTHFLPVLFYWPCGNLDFIIYFVFFFILFPSFHLILLFNSLFDNLVLVSFWLLRHQSIRFYLPSFLTLYTLSMGFIIPCHFHLLKSKPPPIKRYSFYDTKLYLAKRFQFWRYGKCRVDLNCHYSHVYSDLLPVRVPSKDQIEMIESYLFSRGARYIM